jgi:uncharacterized repeat protein (TIGR01451 family)
MRHLALIFVVTGVVALLAPVESLAQGSIELTTVAEQEITTTGEGGEEVTQVVPAGKVVPGTVVIYTVTAKNISQQPLNSVVINDPIPEHMTYVVGSGEGSDTDITYSVDGGSSFFARNELAVSDGAGGTRPPEASDYTHLRWTLNGDLAPAATKSVSFRARLE